MAEEKKATGSKSSVVKKLKATAAAGAYQKQWFFDMKARVEREGKDVTIVSYSIGMKNGRGPADLLAKEGIEAEVIDLITLSPWDKETVLNSVKKTHRLCIVHEAVKQGGFGAEISATVAEEAMEYLDAPILRYGAPFCPIPFAPTLEKMVKVVPEDLVKGIKGMF